MILASPIKEVLKTFLICFRAGRTEEHGLVSYGELYLDIIDFNRDSMLNILNDPKYKQRIKAAGGNGCIPDNPNYVYIAEEPSVKDGLYGGWTPTEVSRWVDNITYDDTRKHWIVKIRDPYAPEE